MQQEQELGYHERASSTLDQLGLDGLGSKQLELTGGWITMDRNVSTAIRKVLLVAMATAFLGACSKSSVGSSSPTVASPSSDWDSLTWDQGNWG
jgi:hypothetical protein